MPGLHKPQSYIEAPEIPSCIQCLILATALEISSQTCTRPYPTVCNMASNQSSLGVPSGTTPDDQYPSSPPDWSCAETGDIQVDPLYPDSGSIFVRVVPSRLTVETDPGQPDKVTYGTSVYVRNDGLDQFNNDPSRRSQVQVLHSNLAQERQRAGESKLNSKKYFDNISERVSLFNTVETRVTAVSPKKAEEDKAQWTEIPQHKGHFKHPASGDESKGGASNEEHSGNPSPGEI